MSCIPPCSPGEVIQVDANYIPPAVFIPPTIAPHFAKVWKDAFDALLDLHFDVDKTIEEADKVLARYREVYNGA